MSPCHATNWESPMTSLLKSTYAKLAAFARLQKGAGQNSQFVPRRSKTKRRLIEPSEFTFLRTVKHFTAGPRWRDTTRSMFALWSNLASPSLPRFDRKSGSSYERTFPIVFRDDGSRLMYCSRLLSNCFKRGERFSSGIGFSATGRSIHSSLASTTSPRERPCPGAKPPRLKH